MEKDKTQQKKTILSKTFDKLSLKQRDHLKIQIPEDKNKEKSIPNVSKTKTTTWY